jgi:hypothetical protein
MTMTSGKTEEQSGIPEYIWNSFIGKDVKTLDLESIGNLSTLTDDFVIITSLNRQDHFVLPKLYLEAYDEDEIFLSLFPKDLERFHL